MNQIAKTDEVHSSDFQLLNLVLHKAVFRVLYSSSYIYMLSATNHDITLFAGDSTILFNNGDKISFGNWLMYYHWQNKNNKLL